MEYNKLASDLMDKIYQAVDSFEKKHKLKPVLYNFTIIKEVKHENNTTRRTKKHRVNLQGNLSR